MRRTIELCLWRAATSPVIWKPPFSKRIFGLWMASLLFLQTGSLAVAEVPAAAQEPFNEGLAAAKAGDYQSAFNRLQEARKTAPLAPEILFNLGWVESKMSGRELRSICWFSAYLAAATNPVNAGAVKKKIQELKILGKTNAFSVIHAVQDAAQEVPPSPNDLQGTSEHRLRDVAVLWADAGDIAAARRIHDLIHDVNSKGQAELYIAIAQWDSGDKSGAGKTMADARKLADQFHDDDKKNHCLAHIADVCVGLDDIADAQKSAEQVQDANLKDEAEYKIASQQAIDGNVAAARKTTTLIKGLVRKGQAQADIALIQAKNWDIRAAIETANSIEDLGTRGGAFWGVAFAQRYIQEDIPGAQASIAQVAKCQESIEFKQKDNVKADDQLFVALLQLRYGDMAGCQRTLVRAQNATKGTLGLATRAVSELVTAESQIKAGELAAARITLLGARNAADLAEDRDWKTALEFQIAKDQVRAKDLSGAKMALAKVRKIADGRVDDNVSEIVEVQAQIGDISGAQETAALIKDESYGSKAIAECRIAEAQLASGDVSSARDEFIKARMHAAHAEAIMETYSASGLYKSHFDRKFLEAQKRLGLPGESWPPQSNTDILPSRWVMRVDDDSADGECPLKIAPFLDLPSYLKSQVAEHQGDYKALFDVLLETAKTMITAQDVIERMLKGDDVLSTATERDALVLDFRLDV